MTPLASGRDCDVFALDDDRVLRRYRSGADACAEADIMTRVRGLGFPVPQVFSCEGADIVMQRLEGGTMLRAIGTEIGLDAAARMLAGLHEQLHHIGFIHLDLHPENVIITEQGPMVLNWRHATEGDPDLDIAMTALIVAQAAVDPRVSFSSGAAAYLRAFLHHAGGDPMRMLDTAVAARAADSGLSPDETALLPQAAALIRLMVGGDRKATAA